jgi:predicted GNAT family N-acyltransferase
MMEEKNSIQRITWEDTMSIRHKVLWPNKPIEFCQVKGDLEALHFGYFLNNQLVSVASVYLDKNSARLRKFATLQEVQGKGIGTRLLNHVLSTIKEESIDYFWCDARESAIEFYTRFGMHAEGDRFYKEDVAYFKMSITFQ